MIRITVDVWKRFCSLTKPSEDQEMEAEMKNVLLRAGEKLKVEGKINANAKRFQIDLGSSSSELALHFNPRFYEDDSDTPVLVCNSRSDDIWDQEQRDSHNPFHPGSTFKAVLKHTGRLFEVKLPDGQEIEFPNRQGMEIITYIRVKGDISLRSIKID